MDENTSTPPASQSGGNKNMMLIGLFVLIVVGVIGFIVLMGRRSATPVTNSQAAQPSPTTAEGAVVKVTEEASPSGAAMGEAEGEVKEFTVEASSFKFNPATITVNKGDTVKITLTNKDGFHDFTIDEFNTKTKQLQAGQNETIEFVADQAGTFEYYCSVGNHRQQGMVGKLIVQ